MTREPGTTLPQPSNVVISRADDGRWGWDVFYDDEHEALNDGGHEDTLDAALTRVKECLERR